MPYYPDPYSGWASGISTLGDSAVKAINTYHEDAEKGRFADTMMNEFMKIPGAVPEDIQEKWGKMNSSKKSDSLVAVQFRMARAAQQAKQQREDEDRQFEHQARLDTHNKMVAEAAKLFLGDQFTPTESTLPSGQRVVQTSPGHYAPQAAAPAEKTRTGQIDLDAQGRPKVDLQRNIFYSGGVPMILTGDMRKQFEDAQSQGAADTKGIEGQIAHQQAAGGKPLPGGARYGSREEKLAALRAQRQSKLGLFGTPAGSGTATAEASPAPSPAAAAIAPDRVVVMSPPNAKGQRQTYTIPHQQLTPFLNANKGWSVMPANQPTPPPQPQASARNYGPVPGAQPQFPEEDMNLEDLLMA